ncbi:V4R domain-containing protein [Vulcaniibacterium tengchongense]|uniref:V4R domain-containing protein n=1 Tax=Vulcaniibacterium tengchongense TaxID=1273429 RepID=A0A3N4VDX2_9GAMM|nr:V4R domain-containing protein [Vulcaniibacterium tengchongense]RPE79993.1 V4R domain-containing protein [Vulcaniibacterium tengchongense]
MVDVEFRVVADRREGLLLALGQTVIACGFTLLRQRMVGSHEGVVLTMLVRGPDAQLLQLEDRLGAHPLVRSFEAARPDAPPASAPAVTPAAAQAAAPDAGRIEALLPQLARDYPNIFIPLLALERELPPEQRESTLRYIGQRVGAWVYKRDFALGGRLALHDAVRHIALPALRQIVQAELHEDALKVRNSPFCHRGEAGACCHFLRGMLGGLLGDAHGGEHLHVVESQCRNAGAALCSFEFRA